MEWRAVVGGLALVAARSVGAVGACIEGKGCPPCAFLAFRHIAKTGGMTVAYWLEYLRRTSAWDGPFIGVEGECTNVEWQAFMEEFEQAPEHFVRRHPFLYVMFHKKTVKGFMGNVMPGLRRLRPIYGRLGCRFVVATMVREPLSWARSSWNYHVRNYWMHNSYFRDITDFTGSDEVSQQLLGLPYSSIRTKEELTAVQRRKLFSSLSSDYEIVGTTDRFAESMLLMAMLAGVDLSLVTYWHANAAQRNSTSTLSHAGLMDNTTAVEKIRNLLKTDALVYRSAVERLAKQLRNAGEPLQRVFRSNFTSPVVHGHMTWFNGRPKRDRFLLRRAHGVCTMGRGVHTASWRHLALPLCVRYGNASRDMWRPAGHRRYTKIRSVFDAHKKVPCTDVQELRCRRTPKCYEHSALPMEDAASLDIGCRHVHLRHCSSQVECAAIDSALMAGRFLTKTAQQPLGRHGLRSPGHS